MVKAPDRFHSRVRVRINMGEPSEVEYWANALGISKARLAEVVRKVGDAVHAVRSEISDSR